MVEHVDILGREVRGVVGEPDGQEDRLLAYDREDRRRPPPVGSSGRLGHFGVAVGHERAQVSVECELVKGVCNGEQPDHCLAARPSELRRASLIRTSSRERARVWRMARRCVCLLAAGAQQACGTRVPVVRHDALLHANGTLRLDTSVVVPRFDPGPEAVAYMREQAREY